jgi:hypothetical protein
MRLVGENILPQLKRISVRTSVADPDPKSGAFLTHDPGWVESQHPDPG